MSDSFKAQFKRLNHQRIGLFRRWRLKILKFCLDQRLDPIEVPLRPEKRRNQNVRIIILRTDGKLGDSITSTYLISGLRTVFPDAHITVVSAPEFKTIFWGLVDEYRIFKLNFFKAIQFVQNLNETYDVLINTSHILNPSSVVLSRFISASRKMIFLNHDWKMFSDHIAFDENQDHVTQRYESVFKALGKKPLIDLHYHFPIESEAKNQVLEILEQRKQQYPFKRLIVVNSFAGARLRNLDQRTLKNLIERLAQTFEDALIVSIGNVGDLRILNQWNADLQHPQWTFFNYGSLDFNAALVNSADLVISPDTSIVHMACALRKKLVAIYREDFKPEKNAKIWGPFGTSYKMVMAPKETPPNEDADINSVDVDQIVQASVELLN